MKNKYIASFIALILGSFGIHKFYLGNQRHGLFYLFFFWTLIPSFFAIVDFFKLIFIDEHTFNIKYNNVSSKKSDPDPIVLNEAPLLLENKEQTQEEYPTETAYQYFERRRKAENDSYKSKIDQTFIVKEIDDFEDTYTIKFTTVAGEKTPYFKMYSPDVDDSYNNYLWKYLGITLTNHNGYAYLDIRNTGNFGIAKGDKIILLFEDKTKITFVFSTPIESYRNTYPLSKEILEILLTKNIEKAKVSSTRRGAYELFGVDYYKGPKINFKDYQYKTKEEGQELLKYMTREFISLNLKNNTNLDILA